MLCFLVDVERRAEESLAQGSRRLRHHHRCGCASSNLLSNDTVQLNAILSSLLDRALAFLSLRFPLDFSSAHRATRAIVGEEIEHHTALHCCYQQVRIAVHHSRLRAATRQSRHKRHSYQQRESDQVSSTHGESIGNTIDVPVR